MSLKRQPIGTLPAKTLINSSWRAWWQLLRAKVLVLDHEYTGFAFSELRKHKKVVQLWHGLPYKALSGNHHFVEICDQAFISSSEWFNQHIFPAIFRAGAYLNLGYPRCDALLQQPAQRVWLNSAEPEKLTQLLNEVGPIWIYMPTYRDDGDNSYQLDLKELNAFCRQAGRALVLKFHPFISRKFSDAMGLSANSAELQPLPQLPHLFLFPSAMNIYPWLADAEALITDYSSVAFDFLVTDKPIVYYQYDKTRYQAIRGNALVEDTDFIAGPLVQNQQQLHQALQQVAEGKDEYAQKRKQLVDKFAICRQPAAPAITDYVRSLA
nr:CDP-glycerol glycerophosphotransferase family protein [Bowmanella dokdonensis]